MDTVSFDVPDLVRQQASAVVRRVIKECPKLRGKDSKLSLWMDLVATHANGCPLQFDRLLTCDSFTLLHDVLGIRGHLDRETGKLTGMFRPRLAEKAAA